MDDFMLDSNLITTKSTDAYESLGKISAQLKKFEKNCKKAYSEINDNNELQSVYYTDFSEESELIEKYIEKYNKFSGEAHTRNNVILGKNREAYYSNPVVVNSMGILGQYEQEVDAKFFAKKEDVLKELSETNLKDITIKNRTGLNISGTANKITGFGNYKDEININDILGLDEISIKLKSQYEEYKNSNPDPKYKINSYEDYMNAIVSGSDFQYATVGATFVSGILDFVPYVGPAKLAGEILLGRNYVTRVDLSVEERLFLLGSVVTVGAISHFGGKLYKSASKAYKNTSFDVKNPLSGKDYKIGIGKDYGNEIVNKWFNQASASPDFRGTLRTTRNNKFGVLVVEKPPVGPVNYNYAAGSIVEDMTDLAIRNSLLNTPAAFSQFPGLKFPAYSNTISSIKSLNSGMPNLLLKEPLDIPKYLEEHRATLPKVYSFEMIQALQLDYIFKVIESERVAITASGEVGASSNFVSGSINTNISAIDGLECSINKNYIYNNLDELNKSINGIEYKGIKGNHVSIEPTTLAEYNKQEKAAIEMYNTFRSVDTDISKISENTGWPVNYIKKIKNHMFLRELRLDSGTRLLDPDYEMANAWERLINGEYYENDILLLKHELYESTYYDLNNCKQREAHDATIKIYDWAVTIY